MTEAKADKTSLSARTTRMIYEHIRRNGLTKGDNLPSEMELSKLLEVSRNVVREALKGLEAIGVVDGGNGRRAKVGAIDPGALGILIDYSIMTRQVTIQQVLDVRRSIENRAAALAAMRRTDVEAEQIARYAKAMQDSLQDRKTLTGFDVSFHKALGFASRNPMHDLFIGAFAAQINEIAPIGWQTRPGDTDLVDIVEQHLPIAEAVMNRDPARAELEMDRHFDLTIRALIASGYQ